MAKIIVNRTSEFANKIRSIELILNDKKIGEINDGESNEFEIEPGIFNLKAKIDWCYSNTNSFTIKEGDVVRFNLSGRNPFLAMFYITFGKNNYLKLTPIN